MCNCDRNPEDDQDANEMMDEWYEREREILDRAEAQQPLDWYKMASDFCLPSLAYQVAIGDVAR